MVPYLQLKYQHEFTLDGHIETIKMTVDVLPWIALGLQLLRAVFKSLFF